MQSVQKVFFFPDAWLWPTQPRLAEIFRERLISSNFDKTRFKDLNWGNGILATRHLQNTPGLLDYYNRVRGDSLDVLGSEVKNLVEQEREGLRRAEEKLLGGSGKDIRLCCVRDHTYTAVHRCEIHRALLDVSGNIILLCFPCFLGERF